MSAFSSSADLSAERVDPADVPAREFLSISILENAAVLFVDCRPP